MWENIGPFGMISSRSCADMAPEKFIPWRRLFIVAVVGVAGGEDGPVKLKLGEACCVAMVFIPSVKVKVGLTCVPDSRR